MIFQLQFKLMLLFHVYVFSFLGHMNSFSITQMYLRAALDENIGLNQ